MLYTHSTEELIGLQDLIIKKSNEKEIHIHGELESKTHICPDCGAETDKIHDYRIQVIKDIPIYKKMYLFLLKSDVIAAHAENASMKIIPFYLVITEELIVCQRICFSLTFYRSFLQRGVLENP